MPRQAYFAGANPSAHENSRNIVVSANGHAFRYVRECSLPSAQWIRGCDPILEDISRHEPHALAHGELIAARRERVEQRVLANGHGVDAEWQLQAHVLDRCATRSHVPPRNGPTSIGERLKQAIGAPNSLCITPGSTRVLFVGESTYPGRIFKVALDGTVLGVIGRSGRNLGQFSGAHALACPTERELYVGETSNWRVQKLLLR